MKVKRVYLYTPTLISALNIIHIMRFFELDTNKTTLNLPTLEYAPING